MKLVEEQPEGYWPVFKGESFDIWEPDRGIYYAWADPEKMIKHLQQKRERSRRQPSRPSSSSPTPTGSATPTRCRAISPESPFVM